MPLTQQQKDALSGFKYRNLNYQMLKDALEIYKAASRPLTSYCAFRCFKSDNLPDTMQQIKQILDFKCPGWEMSQATNINQTHDRLSLALKSVFSRRRVRNSSSARNKHSNTSQIANAMESARGFDPVIISRCSSSARQSSDQVSYRYDDFDKIQAKMLEMKSSLDSLDIRPGWKREAKTTLDGIISFCKDFEDIKSVYNDVKVNATSRADFKTGGSVVYQDGGKCLLYHSPEIGGLDGVGYHLEGYKSFVGFTNSIMCIFQQVIAAHQVATDRRDDLGFFNALYGGYCIDARTYKVIDLYLRASSFCMPFSDLVKNSYLEACAFFELSGTEDNLKNMSEYLYSCYKDMRCHDDVGNPDSLDVTWVTKGLVVNFLVDYMQVYARPIAEGSSNCIIKYLCSCSFFSNSSKSRSKVQANKLLSEDGLGIQ